MVVPSFDSMVKLTMNIPVSMDGCKLSRAAHVILATASHSPAFMLVGLSGISNSNATRYGWWLARI